MTTHVSGPPLEDPLPSAGIDPRPFARWTRRERRRHRVASGRAGLHRIGVRAVDGAQDRWGRARAWGRRRCGARARARRHARDGREARRGRRCEPEPAAYSRSRDGDEEEDRGGREDERSAHLPPASGGLEHTIVDQLRHRLRCKEASDASVIGANRSEAARGTTGRSRDAARVDPSPPRSAARARLWCRGPGTARGRSFRAILGRFEELPNANARSAQVCRCRTRRPTDRRADLG